MDTDEKGGRKLKRKDFEAELRQLNLELEERVAERTHALEEQTRVLAEQAALLDLTRDSVVVRDMERRIVFWSKGAETMTGWPSELATGKVINDLLHTEFSEPLEEIEAHLLREGHWEGEAVQHRRDGTTVVVATRRALQRDSNGAPFQILSVSNDITTRKATEARLRASTERLSLATAVAKIGVWDWDLTDNTLTWDDTMFSIYGLSPVVPMPYERWASAVFPEDLAKVEEILRKAIADKSPGFAEFRIVRADGSPRVISAAESVALDEDRNVTRVIGGTFRSIMRSSPSTLREPLMSSARSPGVTTPLRPASAIKTVFPCVSAWPDSDRPAFGALGLTSVTMTWSRPNARTSLSPAESCAARPPRYQ